MTLVIALKWVLGEGNEAVLVSADSRATTPLGIMYDVRKVRPIVLGDRPVAVASGAGDSSIIKWGFEAAEEIFLKYASEAYPLSREAFRCAIRGLEDALIRRMAELRRNGIEPSFSMIVGGATGEGKAMIYEFNDRGLAEPVHDDPGYAIIGSGFITGGILLMRLLGYRNEHDLGLLTTFMLDSVSEVDASVGPFVGESYMMRMETNEKGEKNLALGPLKEDALREFKEKTATRRELIRRVWSLCEEAGEEKLEKALEKVQAEKNQVE